MNTTPISAPTQTPALTPAQSAVRWHGLVLAAGLAASVPLVHLGWHTGLGHREPPIVTRSQTLAPTFQWDTFADGSWMLAGERHLREASPIAWWLRGHWNELVLRAGVAQSPTVHVGRDGWLFLRAEVEPDAMRFAARAPMRRQAFADVRDRVRAAGAELLVMVVPDKSRIYPDHAFPGSGDGAAKAPLYGSVQAELRQAGILTVDLDQGLLAARAASPDVALFYRGDTHWRPLGAFAAAQAAAAIVEASAVGARLRPRHELRISAQTTVAGLGDLVAALGIATAELPDAQGRRHTTAMSLFAHRFTEALDFYEVSAVDPALALRLDGADPDADILLVGTSYSQVNGLQALMLALGRPVRMVQKNGAASIVPMRQALAELADPARPRPKLVIWEIVERGFLEGDWGEPGF